MKKLRQKKDFRVFVFTLFNALISFIGTQLAGLEWESAIIVTGLAIPLLNVLTKYANTKWFGDLWVTKIDENN